MDAGGGRDQEQNRCPMRQATRKPQNTPRGHFPTGLGRDAARPAPGQAHALSLDLGPKRRSTAAPQNVCNVRQAIEHALARYRERREQQDRTNALRALVASLTPRESEVFGFVVRGKLNKQIAFDLGTSERTIKAHRQSIMHKLQVGSLAKAVSIAERLGVLGMPHDVGSR